jgi:hypothetical protein
MPLGANSRLGILPSGKRTFERSLGGIDLSLISLAFGSDLASAYDERLYAIDVGVMPDHQWRSGVIPTGDP